MIINPGGSLPANPTITGTLTIQGGLVMATGASADFHNVNINNGALNIGSAAAISCNGSANLNNGVNMGGNVNIANSGVFSVAAAQTKFTNLPIANPGAGTKRAWTNANVVTIAL